MRWIGDTLGPIGLDLGNRYVKAVQLRYARGGRVRVAAVASVERTNPGAAPTVEEVRRIADVLYRQGFSGTDVVLGVPLGKLLVGILELPPKTAGAPYEQMARLEFARHTKCDPGSFEMAYWELPQSSRGSKTSNVMAVGCRVTDAEALLAPFDAVGLDVLSMDSGSVAAARACAPLLWTMDDVSAILDLGWRSASLVILHNGTIIYDRPLAEAGLDPLYERLQKSLGVEREVVDVLVAEHGISGLKDVEGRSPQAITQVGSAIAEHFDGMLKELELSFSYAVQQYAGDIGRLLLIGGGAGIPGLAERWGAAMGVTVQAVGPADVVECGDSLLGRCGPSFTTALGLAQGVKP
jgi:Tfp pilus assembly PilM family ATPase